MSLIQFGVVGGMGPEATTKFVDLVTRAAIEAGASTDQEHPNIMLLSFGAGIPNRIDYIKWLREGGEESGHTEPQNPIPVLRGMVETLYNGGCQFAVMPCNTAHALRAEIQEGSRLFMLSMIKSTLEHIQDRHPESKVGLLASTETVETEIYSTRTRDLSMGELLTPTRAKELDNGELYDIQEVVHSAVIGHKIGEIDGMDIRREDGIKSGKYEEGVDRLAIGLQNLKEQGATVVILGCTEFPLVQDLLIEQYPHIADGIEFVDPMEVTAERVVQIYQEAQKILDARLQAIEKGSVAAKEVSPPDPSMAKTDGEIAKYVADTAYIQSIAMERGSARSR